MNKNKNQSKRLDPMLIWCFIALGAAVIVFSLFIPYDAKPSGDVRISLSAQTNRFGDNWTALTYNGVVTTNKHGNESSGSITGTNLIVPRFDHVGTNLPTYFITDEVYDSRVQSPVQSVLKLKENTNILELWIDSTNLVTVSNNGTITLSNTNLDLVSSNFWKVLGQYFSDHYVLKEQ